VYSVEVCQSVTGLLNKGEESISSQPLTRVILSYIWTSKAVKQWRVLGVKTPLHQNKLYAMEGMGEKHQISGYGVVPKRRKRKDCTDECSWLLCRRLDCDSSWKHIDTRRSQVVLPHCEPDKSHTCRYQTTTCMCQTNRLIVNNHTVLITHL